MNDASGGINRSALIALGVLALVFFGMLTLWKYQAMLKEADFKEALRAGRVETLPAALREKQWSHAELDTVKTIRLDKSAGLQRALLRTIHQGHGFHISSQQYAYEAIMIDLETGRVHRFGLPRVTGRTWRHVSSDPLPMAEDTIR
jgi:hypothetical protein